MRQAIVQSPGCDPGNSVVEEDNGSAEPIKDHVWGLAYIDEAVQTRINTNPTGTASWNAYWLMQDANYNVLGVVDSSGVLAERYEYTPYGERHVFASAGSNDPGCYAPQFISTRVVTSGSVTEPYGLCEIGHQGLMHDEEAGVVCNRARTLNPMLGRFMQEDPLGFVDSANLYAVGDCEPVDTLDPSGASFICDLMKRSLPPFFTDGKTLSGQSQTEFKYTVELGKYAKVQLKFGYFWRMSERLTDCATCIDLNGYGTGSGQLKIPIPVWGLPLAVVGELHGGANGSLRCCNKPDPKNRKGEFRLLGVFCSGDIQYYYGGKGGLRLGYEKYKNVGVDIYVEGGLNVYRRGSLRTGKESTAAYGYAKLVAEVGLNAKWSFGKSWEARFGSDAVLGN